MVIGFTLGKIYIFTVVQHAKVWTYIDIGILGQEFSSWILQHRSSLSAHVIMVICF
jgi:hypothetical protein